jgi:hypothetical protein
MSSQNTPIFQGPIRIYLQGQNALCPQIPAFLEQGMHYHIGQENTELTIHDYRDQPVKAAKEILTTQYQNGFAGKFSQRAWAKIHYDQITEKIEIELHELKEPGVPESPLLWLGVLEDNIMPDYDVEWEVFKPLDNGQTAFVSLLPYSPSF